jgi:hypothetical protein
VLHSAASVHSEVYGPAAVGMVVSSHQRPMHGYLLVTTPEGKTGYVLTRYLAPADHAVGNHHHIIHHYYAGGSSSADQLNRDELARIHGGAPPAMPPGR